MIIVQRITTSWTKSTRGAQGREERARLPHAYTLPSDLLLAMDSNFYHDVQRSEQGRYGAHESATVTPKPATRKGSESASAVVLEERDGVLLVSFRWIDIDCGAPRRPLAGPVEVTPGQTARVRFNGRFVGYEDGWYEHKIINVAYACPVSSEVFTTAPPSVTLDALVDLW